MTSEPPFRANSLAIQTWFWGRGAALPPGGGPLSPPGPGTSVTDAGSSHQMPGFFGLHTQYFSKTKQYEKPDEFLSELRLGEFTAQEYGAGSNGLPTRAAACVPSKDTQARGSDREHVELMLTHLF